MNVYRKKPLPAIYTRLRFVRKASNFTLADCPDDLPYLVPPSCTCAVNEYRK